MYRRVCSQREGYRGISLSSEAVTAETAESSCPDGRALDEKVDEKAIGDSPPSSRAIRACRPTSDTIQKAVCHAECHDPPTNPLLNIHPSHPPAISELQIYLSLITPPVGTIAKSLYSCGLYILAVSLDIRLATFDKGGI
jgi:hypothetical protein